MRMTTNTFFALTKLQSPVASKKKSPRHKITPPKNRPLPKDRGLRTKEQGARTAQRLLTVTSCNGQLLAWRLLMASFALHRLQMVSSSNSQLRAWR